LDLSCEGEDEELSAVPLEVEDGERGTVVAGEFEFAAAVGVIDIDGVLEGARGRHKTTRRKTQEKRKRKH